MRGYQKVNSSVFVLRNCFRKPCVTPVRSAPEQEDKYVAEEVTVDFIEGEKRNMVVHDYPITQESVNSYVEMSDYKNNPAAFCAPRVNLGDIREAQKGLMGNSDVAVFAEKIKELQAKIDQLQKVKSDENVNVEGGNNG